MRFRFDRRIDHVHMDLFLGAEAIAHLASLFHTFQHHGTINISVGGNLAYRGSAETLAMMRTLAFSLPSISAKGFSKQLGVLFANS